MSQPGSTAYPLSGSQIRTLARVQLEFEFILDQNMSLTQMMEWCDSIHVADSVAILGLQTQLSVKDEQLANREQKIALMDEQYTLAKGQLKLERRKRFMYMGTTAGALALLVLILLTGG